MGRMPPHPRCFGKWQLKDLRDTELGRRYGKPNVGMVEGLQVGMLKRKRRGRPQDLRGWRRRTHPALIFLCAASVSQYSACRSEMMGVMTRSMVFGAKRNSAIVFRLEPGGRMMSMSLLPAWLLPERGRSLSNLARIAGRRTGDFFVASSRSFLVAKADEPLLFSENCSRSICQESDRLNLRRKRCSSSSLIAGFVAFAIPRLSETLTSFHCM